HLPPIRKIIPKERKYQMEQLQVFEQNGELYTDSRDVAVMTEKRHADLLRDIENYKSAILQNANLRSDDFFVESSYQAGTGKMYKHYLLTKKGCDMVANKMTGEKGILFTAMYVDQFHKMENHIKSKQYQVPSSPMEALEMMFSVQKESREEVQKVKSDIQSIRDIVAIETKDWRNDTNKVLNRIAQTLGGGTYHKDIRTEAYQHLETKGRCKLDQRVNNRKAKALANGSAKTGVQKISKLDVIGEEPRLIEIYISVIQKMAIKYGVDFKEVEGA
ncbi:Rha family transcriptional regulator, partial [Salinicoccus albus]|uniref:Rha family transcriptional regulator n=1 Tax=Salinicoccus albus TaxID=418756 RepID=UPI00037B845C